MRSLFLLPLLLSTFALAQTLPPPKIIREQSGKIVNLYAEGNLESYQTIGCIPLAEAKNTYTPPDLYKGAGTCIAQENYDLAARLFALADIYAMFDGQRITDKTAAQGRIVLTMNTFSNITDDKKNKFKEALNHQLQTHELLKNLCSEVERIGAPSYYPSYMILHGVKAFMGNPHEGALVKDFDTPGAWKSLQSRALKCPN